MQPIRELKITGITVKEYPNGIIIQKGKDIIFLNEEQYAIFAEVINTLVKEK